MNQTNNHKKAVLTNPTTTDQAGEITLNPVLWNELSHYFDPVEISLLDMDRSVVVDGRQYTAGPVAIHSRGTATQGTELRLEAYYGEDGDTADKEIALIHAHRLNLEELASYDFKDPFARERYEEYVSLQKVRHNGDPLVSNLSRPPCGSNCDFKIYYWRDSSGFSYDITYRDTPTGPVRTAHMRWYNWNESYRTGIAGIRKRSRGGTITEIYRIHDGQGWRTMPDNNIPIGLYHENGTIDYSYPITQVHVIPRGRAGVIKDELKWQVRLSDINRDANKGTESTHSAWVRYNNSNNPSAIMVDFFVG